MMPAKLAQPAQAVASRSLPRTAPAVSTDGRDEPRSVMAAPRVGAGWHPRRPTGSLASGGGGHAIEVKRHTIRPSALRRTDDGGRHARPAAHPDGVTRRLHPRPTLPVHSQPAAEERAMSFWDIVWFIFITYAFVAYLVVLFHIIGDVFRDEELPGLAKAAWVIALCLIPLLAALSYLIVRGRGMAERSAEHAEARQAAQDAHIRQVA